MNLLTTSTDGHLAYQRSSHNVSHIAYAFLESVFSFHVQIWREGAGILMTNVFLALFPTCAIPSVVYLCSCFFF